MLKSEPLYIWEKFDDEPQDESAWQAFVSVKSGQTRTGQPQSRNFIYELLVAFVVIGTVAGMVLWQRAETRFHDLEAELQELRSTLSAIQTRELAEPAKADKATDSTLLPTSQVIETDYFRFHFHEEDTAIVTAVADGSDAQYRRLRQNLGLATLTVLELEFEKLWVYVTTEEHDKYSMSDPTASEFRLVLSSPKQLDAKGIDNPAEKLSSDLYNLLTRRGLNELLQDHEILLQWEALVENLFLYFWKNQILKPGWPQNAHYLRRRHYAQSQSIHLFDQTEYIPPKDTNGWTSADRNLTYLIAGPLVEFIMVEYGIAYVPSMLDAFDSHETWDSLAPAVFGVSAREFEAQWHAYLREHYPID